MKLSISVKQWRLVDVHNLCVQHDLEFDVKEQKIVLLETNGG